MNRLEWLEESTNPEILAECRRLRAEECFDIGFSLASAYESARILATVEIAYKLLFGKSISEEELLAIQPTENREEIEKAFLAMSRAEKTPFSFNDSYEDRENCRMRFPIEGFFKGFKGGA
jgi:hypothetical protein